MLLPCINHVIECKNENEGFTVILQYKQGVINDKTPMVFNQLINVSILQPVITIYSYHFHNM